MDQRWQPQYQQLRHHLVSLDGEPAFPTTPVLSLELGNISKMSKGGREGLSYMWTVFSRCKESIRDGRRLENLSWRLWYEDLKLTGCISSSPAPLSDPEFEADSDDVSNEDDNSLFEDVVDAQDESADGSATENVAVPSSDQDSDPRRSDLPLIDGVHETPQPNLSRGRTKQGNKPVEGGVVEGHLEGPALDSATLSSSSPLLTSSRTRSVTAQPVTLTSPSTSTTQAVSSSSHSSSHQQSELSPSKHTRRSSCPASRDREMLRISRMSNGEDIHSSEHATQAAKKEKRAFSFANAHRPPHPQRLARAMPPLTPETIQDIIGTVLPMNFKSSPRIELTSPPPLPSSTSTANRSSPTASGPPIAALSIERKSASPTRGQVDAKVQHTREPSIKSERSYFTSTTAFSDSAVDPVFSPRLDSSITRDDQILPELTSHEATSSAPQSITNIDDSNASNAPPSRLTQSEETTRLVKSPSPEHESNEEHPPVAHTMQRNSSHHKSAVKPALLTRGKTSSASSTKLNGSALQRTQSAKSVRIIESPTEADGTAVEGTSGEATHLVASATTVLHPHHTTHAHHKNHKHSHIAPKRNLSSSKPKGHTRNASSASLHREGRIKTPPPILETPSPDAAHAAAPNSTSTAATERPEMQAAPHVTKAINIRRNNSSLANIIQTEPRSISRGFAVPSSASNGDIPNGSNQSDSDTGVSSPSSTAVAAAEVQSVPDNVPSLHPPPPSPASPVVMVPSSVILPPQPRSSPADPRFRVHSTIRRPASPPVEEEEEVERSLSPSQSDHVMTSRTADADERRTVKTSGRVDTLPATRSSNRSSTAPRDMKPEPQQLTNAKKKQMFFFSSPTTDSDDEGGHTGSFKLKLASPLPVDSNSTTAAPGHAQITSIADNGEKTKNSKNKEKASAKPANKVVQVTTPTEEERKKKHNSHHHSEDDEDDNDDEYEDEEEDDDDSDEWSSEASESEEDEHQAAVRREEERQRLMFAKRTPSMVATQGGLLSKLLRPEEYNHGSANMPVHLRNNASAMHLNQLPNVGSTAGIERVRASNTLFTVTGMLASKSTAALPDLQATERSSRLVPTKSGNHLTRLGGAPSGVELESDDDEDDEDGAQPFREISPTQQKNFTALMQRTTSTQGKQRNTTPPRQQEAPLTQVSRVTSAAEITKQLQPEATNIFTPRTTRRNMLATELTESLRTSLLAERNKNTGIGRIVSAVGNRFGVRQQQQQQQPLPPQHYQPQPDSAPSQIQAPPSSHLQPPRIQRGSTGFTPANRDGSAVDRLRPGAARPPANTRAHSDPPQQTEYYSPGFHHTGW